MYNHIGCKGTIGVAVEGLLQTLKSETVWYGHVLATERRGYKRDGIRTTMGTHVFFPS